MLQSSQEDLCFLLPWRPGNCPRAHSELHSWPKNRLHFEGHLMRIIPGGNTVLTPKEWEMYQSEKKTGFTNVFNQHMQYGTGSRPHGYLFGDEWR